MTLISQKNRSVLPTVVSDFLNAERFLGPSLLDFNGSLLDNNVPWLVPSANIVETEKEYNIELAAPGLERKDFKIELDGDNLSISTEKEEKKSETGKNFTRKEFSYNAFCRTFTLPENSLAEKIDAKYQNGILLVTIPKKEITLSKPKREIKVA